MKNTKKGFILPVVILVVAALAIGTGVYYSKSSKTDVESTTETTAETNGEGSLNVNTSANVNVSTEGSLKGLLSVGGSKTCDVDFVVPGNSDTKGTVYITDGKLRGDYTIVAEGQTIKSHFLMDGTNVYTWMDGIGTGVKMAMGAEASSGVSAQTTSPINDTVNYTCRDVVADASVFVVPTSVTFTDMTSVTVPPRAF